MLVLYSISDVESLKELNFFRNWMQLLIHDIACIERKLILDSTTICKKAFHLLIFGRLILNFILVYMPMHSDNLSLYTKNN